MGKKHWWKQLANSNLADTQPLQVTVEEARHRYFAKANYVAVFWKHCGGAHFCSSDAFDPESIPANSASYMELPRILDAVWVQEEVSIGTEKLLTTMGYSKAYDIGYIFLDVRGLSTEEQDSPPLPEQYAALRNFMKQSQTSAERLTKVNIQQLVGGEVQ